ncbi:hypothetical protein J25TS5_01930 [Paenibacillus faecis]|nr:hypothetical protein J25TS5_01930 [Paenibacillus faecis]
MPRQSRLTIQNCILKGYFPAELPPPFSTKSLSDEISNIINSTSGITLNINGQKIYSSQCSVYSIPKILHQRRILGIPNPYHQLKVFETIISNWSEIKK